MDELLSSIGAREAQEILQALVRVSSVNPPGGTEAAVAALGACLDRGQIEHRRLFGRDDLASLVARLPGRRPGKTLLLNGHIDVVPPGEGWTFDPFGATERDGRFYGRGACDMKGGLAAMALAMLALKRAGSPFAGEVLVTAVADEETGGRHGTRYLLEQGVGMGADFAIVGEPTNGRVELGNRGVAWFEIMIAGRAGHPGRPHGANPIHYAGRLIAALAGMQFSLRHDLFEVPTPSLTVTMVSGGVKANVIPNLCTLTVDRRLLPGETSEVAQAQIESTIAGLTQEGVTASVTCVQSSEPYLIDRSEPVAQALARGCQRVVGVEPIYSAKGGGTDGSHLYHFGGIPTALYGPGDPRLAHTADESVELRSVVEAARVYAATILDLLGEGE